MEEGIVTFNEWAKMDLRVGEILEIEDITGADKLFKLKIDLGTETRILVAGLKKHYTKEELDGKRCIVFCNLEPKTLKGIELIDVKNDKRICEVPYDTSIPVETWWDLGIGDSTAIWFVQRVGEEIHVIDYYETSGESLYHYAEVLEKKNYNYNRHVAPHDIVARELGTGKSRLEVANEIGIDFEIAAKLEVDHGIESVRNTLPYCYFDREKCKIGLDALRQYRKQWDERNQVFKNKPLHDWCSHAADAFRYGCVHSPIDTSQWTKPIYIDTKYVI
jgi:hypothetical protein